MKKLISNNKKSPMNFNEIDINLLMQNPKMIHKLLNKNNGFNKKPKFWQDDQGEDSLEELNPDGTNHLIMEYINKDAINKLHKEKTLKTEPIKEIAKRKWAEMKKHEEERPKGKALKALIKNPITKVGSKILRPIADFQF